MLTGLRVVGRHLADDLHRKRNALPEAIESGSLGEVPTIQNDQVAVDQSKMIASATASLRGLSRGFWGNASHRYITC